MSSRAEVYVARRPHEGEVLVWTFAGHNEHGRMVLTVRLQTRDAAGLVGDPRTKEWSIEPLR